MTGPAVNTVAGKPNLLLGAYDMADVGYVVQEYFVTGSATSYTSATASDGVGRAQPSSRADYTTRAVVLRPSDTSAFNGTAVVEWLNVTAGIEAPAVWLMAHRELIRQGYAYVAVSAQQVGIQGGPSLLTDMSLKRQDPQRYSPLTHPGDAFSYDIFAQIGQLVRTGALSDVKPDLVVAVGESQSAMFLTTYVNVVDPLTAAFDGFLVHSRFGPAAPLDGGSIFDTGAAEPLAVRFRNDLRVPVITVITETDLVGTVRGGYHAARQPDDDRLRTWEIPGTAHADNYTIRVGFIDSGSASLERIAAAYAPTNRFMGQRLSHYINFAPQHHYVLQAALSGLRTWILTGNPAPSAPPMELSGSEPLHLVLDENGLAEGGVRTPWVDVPIARTSGLGGEEGTLTALFGSGEPFDAVTLNRLYPGGATEYLERFTRSLDTAIRRGFLLPADRDEIRALAAAAYDRARSPEC